VTRRGRRVVAAILPVAVLLFAGRWTAGLLAERWWADAIAPAAVSFLTGWHLLRLTLGAGAVLVASAWFVANLILVYRAIGTVQIARRVANLEIHEALTPAALLTVAVAGGVLLGLLAGAGAGGWTPAVALAWRGVAFGAEDPALGHDLGLYVAQLPLWRILHGFALLLVLLALGIAVALYSLIGALRWMGGRPAINDHARRHLGWLLALLALALGWGYLLEPYELVAGIAGVPDRPTVDLTTLVSPALAGTALMVAVMSVVWALQPRHALVAAGWLVLVITSVGGHYLLPAFNRDPTAPAVDPDLTRSLERRAFGLEVLRDSAEGRLLRAGSPPRLAPLWGGRAVSLLAGSEAADSAPADPAVLAVEARRLPVWLLLRPRGVGAVAADRVTATGEPLYYRLGDTLPYPTPYSLLEFSPHAVRPGAPEYDLSRYARRATSLDTWPKRLALAWALQLGRLLGNVPADARLAWRLSPRSRLEGLLPFVAWSTPVARVVDNELLWLCDGYVAASTFPLVERVPWREGAANLVRAGFVGVVRAESGETRIYLRRDGGPLAEAWAAVAAGVVRPPGELPPAIAAALPYPLELFQLQALVLERAPWGAGALTGRSESGAGEPAPPERGWRPDTGGTRLTALYERPVGQRMSAALVGATRAGLPVLELVRFDSTATLPAPRILEATWARFPAFTQLLDSIRASGVRPDTLLRGALTLWRDGGVLGLYRTYFAPRFGGGLSLVWVGIAQQGRRPGAGRTLDEAWKNLRGVTAPLPPALPSAALEEARRWLRLADSSLRAGDWDGFGRALDALRQVLGEARDTSRR